MVTYAKTAIVLENPREALLYFDHIVPVNLFWELMPWKKYIPDSGRLPAGQGAQFLHQL